MYRSTTSTSKKARSTTPKQPTKPNAAATSAPAKSPETSNTSPTPKPMISSKKTKPHNYTSSCYDNCNTTSTQRSRITRKSTLPSLLQLRQKSHASLRLPHQHLELSHLTKHLGRLRTLTPGSTEVSRLDDQLSQQIFEIWTSALR